MKPDLLSLVAACTSFVGTHFALSHPLRAPLTGALGERGFQLAYSLVAFVTFAWMVLAFRAVGPGGGMLWSGMGDLPWGLASALMLPASVLLVGSFIRNPALPDPRAKNHLSQAVHGVFQVTRHPMMWSFAIWALSHMLVSPTPRSLVLSGTVAFLALVGAHMQDRKKAELLGQGWAGWAARTSYWPNFAGLAKAGALPWIGGVLLWLLATWAHIHANGMDAGIWRWL